MHTVEVSCPYCEAWAIPQDEGPDYRCTECDHYFMEEDRTPASRAIDAAEAS